MSYMTTQTIAGRFAYRAWDGQWYILNHDGSARGTSYDNRSAAVAALVALKNA